MCGLQYKTVLVLFPIFRYRAQTQWHNKPRDENIVGIAINEFLFKMLYANYVNCTGWAKNCTTNSWPQFVQIVTDFKIFYWKIL